MVDRRSPEFALSIRQPWATLILLGLKTVEIRRWSTTIRDRIYLHAGKIADDRDEGWSRIPDDFRHLTDLRGGLIGTVNLVDCLSYRTFVRFEDTVSCTSTTRRGFGRRCSTDFSWNNRSCATSATLWGR